MTKWQAQYNFWSKFGVPAYEQNSVPDTGSLSYPYITYQGISNNFNDSSPVNASIWTRDTSWKEAMTITDRIQEELGYGGSVVFYDGGLFWVQMSNNFAQTMGDPNDDMIKRVVITVNIQF